MRPSTLLPEVSQQEDPGRSAAPAPDTKGRVPSGPPAPLPQPRGTLGSARSPHPLGWEEEALRAWQLECAAYARFRVWKILEICSMTGPVSGSFIHWVLFSGFSSMSSNAVGRHRAAGGPHPTRPTCSGGSSPPSSFQVSGDREPPRPPPRASHLLTRKAAWSLWVGRGDTPMFPGAGTLESIVATATRNLKIVTARDSVIPLPGPPWQKRLM